MRWLRTVAAALWVLVLPGAGWGADMKLGLAGEVEYDDNVGRSQFRERDDVIFRVTPMVRFLEDEGKFHWDLSYRAPWEKGVKTEWVDGFRHFMSAGLRYQFSRRTQGFFDDRFSYTDAVTRIAEIEDPEARPLVGTFREEVIRNDAKLGVEHDFTPRLAGKLSFGHRLFESELADRADNRVYFGSASLVHGLSQRHQLGGGLRTTFHDFDESNNGLRPPSQTLFFHMFALWTWFVDETTTLRLRAGPTFVDADQDLPSLQREGRAVPFVEQGADGVTVADIRSCGTVDGRQVLELCSDFLDIPNENPGGVEADDIRDEVQNPVWLLSYDPDYMPSRGSRTEWTLFGEASLTKRWTPNVDSTLSYVRTESTASGLWTSATLDFASLVTTWRISEFWTAAVRADFTRRESAAPAEQTLTVVTPSTTVANCGDCAETVELISRVVESNVDTDRWGAGLRIARRIGENLSVSARYVYNRQRSKQRTAGRISDFENHLVSLGVEYQFDRWRLW